MGTVTMWTLLVTVTILNCQLSLGQDVASEDTQLLEPRYECPQSSVSFDGNNIVQIPGIQNWHECGIICIHTNGCNFWTWYNDNKCHLKTSDHGLAYDEAGISGEKGCQ